MADMNPCPRCNGSGTDPEMPAEASIRLYLQVSQRWMPWISSSDGAREAWRYSPPGATSSRTLVLPGDASALTAQIARAEGRTYGQVIAAIRDNEKVPGA